MAGPIPAAPIGGLPPAGGGASPNPALAALTAKPPGSTPPNIGPVVSPQANMGNAVKAMSDVRNAVKMLESALPNIPIGSPLHTEILNSTKALLKHLQPGEGNAGLDLMSLLQMSRQAATAQPQQALLKQLAPPPNAPPAMAAAPALAA